jgi:hypothetical protein
MYLPGLDGSLLRAGYARRAVKLPLGIFIAKGGGMFGIEPAPPRGAANTEGMVFQAGMICEDIFAHKGRCACHCRLAAG